jgi:hypothetical protein
VNTLFCHPGLLCLPDDSIDIEFAPFTILSANDFNSKYILSSFGPVDGQGERSLSSFDIVEGLSVLVFSMATIKIL